MRYLIVAIISFSLLTSICSCTRMDEKAASSLSEISSFHSSSVEVSKSSSSQNSNTLVGSTSRQSSTPSKMELSSSSLQMPSQESIPHFVQPSLPVQSSQTGISSESIAPPAQSEIPSSNQPKKNSHESRQTYIDSPTVLYSELLQKIISDETPNQEWPEELDVRLILKVSLEIDQLEEEFNQLRHFDSVKEFEEMGININSNVIEMNSEFTKAENQWNEKWEPRRKEILQQIAQLRQEYEKQVLSETLDGFFPVDTEKGERYFPADSYSQTVLWLFLTPEEIRAIYQSDVAESLFTTIDAETNPIS